ncbi:MAG: hypothetical protein ABIH04_00435 [Planctomycetota bacterium]
MKRSRKIIIIAIIVIFGIPLLGALGLGGYVAYDSITHRPIRFSSEKWKEGDKATRGRMWQDLRKSGILIGKTGQEIIDLLGEPELMETSDPDTPLNMIYPIKGEAHTLYVYCIEAYYDPIFRDWYVRIYIVFDESGHCTETFTLD